jgi:uncharacterized protein YegL
MDGEAMNSLNQSVRKLHSTLASSPRVSAIAHVSIIAFNEQAELVLPLQDVSEVGLTEIPTIEAGGGTHYEAAFDLLQDRIRLDVQNLKDSQFQAYRPVVMFFTDGQPTSEGWKASIQSLLGKDFNYRPHMLAFGMGASVDEGVLASCATNIGHVGTNEIQTAAFIMGTEDEDAASIIERVMGRFTQTIVKTATSLASDESSGPEIDVESIEKDGGRLVKTRPIIIIDPLD